MDRLVKEALGGAPAPGHPANLGHYRLKGPDNHEILPAMWSTTVQPRLVVFLVQHGGELAGTRTFALKLGDVTSGQADQSPKPGP